jgi:hypothetical protein
MTEPKEVMIKEEPEYYPPAASTKAYIEPYMTIENGVPVKKTRIALKKEDVQEMKYHAAQQMYVGDWDPINQDYNVDERYVGMTKLEVAQHKQIDAAARGDLQALNQVEDRILGRPKQQVESVQISATLEDFLSRVAEQEGMVSDSSSFYGEDVIEGEVVGSSPSDTAIVKEPKDYGENMEMDI